MEGLTGHIMFTDDGKRYNYTLHIVQMTIDSTITKVRISYFRVENYFINIIFNWYLIIANLLLDMYKIKYFCIFLLLLRIVIFIIINTIHNCCVY